MSILVKPVLVSVAMSNIVNLSGYQFFMTVLQRVLFPISPLRYSHQNPRTTTKDPYYSRKSDALFQNISMMGLTYVANQEREGALVCLHLNFETKHSKVGILDSGCNNAMQVLTDDVRACVVDFDTNGRITVDQVHGEFTTDASVTLGITLNAISDTGSVFDFDFIVEKCNWFVIYRITYFLHLFSLAEDVMCSSMGERALLTRIQRARARSDFMKSKVILVNSWEKSI